MTTSRNTIISLRQFDQTKAYLNSEKPRNVFWCICAIKGKNKNKFQLESWISEKKKAKSYKMTSKKKQNKTKKN